MTNEYVVKTKRMHCLLGIVLAAALLYLGLDLHFFHSLKGWRVTPNSPVWLLFSVGGALLLVFSVKAFVSPRTLLKADINGITIYAGNIAVELGSNSASKPPKKGDARVIPWSQIRQIGRGKMLTGTQIMKGTGYSTDALGGTVTVGAKHGQNFTDALQVLCDRSVSLKGFETSGLSVTWNGYTEDDLRQMSKRDRESMTDESLHSGFLFRKSYLNGGLDNAINVLEAMRGQYSKS